MKSILEKWNRDDLPNEKMRQLSDVIGINNVKAILVKCPGMVFSVPKTFYKISDINYIKKNKGLPIAVIADKLGCSERTVYRKLELVR